ncbi:MAG: fibronectin type III domain-containing protein, partial [Candidatus Eisenbacteria bacterium]|nr:fibronectin type III domain-containing protein [Candidatus Eisenbacteria bacterium]
TLYWYRVLAFNSGYQSNRVGPVSATTHDVPPAAPSHLEGMAINSSRIDLTWTDNSGNETGFQIERATAGAGPYTAIDTTAADVEAYSNTGLTAATTYWYQVSALNALGKSASVDPISVTTAVGPPSKPTGLTATAISSERIDLEWTDTSDNETHFEIERSDAEDGTYVQIDTVGEDGDVFSDRGLDPSTTYWYRVSSSNASGDSTPTTPVSATTLAAP